MNATDLANVLNLHKKWLLGDPTGKRADLCGADLRYADLPTSEKWEVYLSEVVPALLQVGGKTIAEVTAGWDCHSWDNCPMALAFNVHNSADAPALYRPRIEQFIQFFDANLIPKPIP